MWASGQVKECRAIAPSLYGLVWSPKRPLCFLSCCGGPAGRGDTDVLPDAEVCAEPREGWRKKGGLDGP